jgi:Zn-dependent protease
MLDFGIQINLILAMFNLLPIPPLDGSHVMKYILPPAWALRYQTIGAGGLLILMLLLVFFRGALLAWLAPAFALDALLSGSVRSFLLAGR